MEVGVAEAKDRLSELIGLAEQGEPVTITRHGRAVATLNATHRRPTPAELDWLFREIAEDRAKLPPITTAEILDAIKADRKY